MQIFIVLQNIQDYREVTSFPVCAFTARSAAEAECVKRDIETPRNREWCDGIITYTVCDIPLDKPVKTP